ncbi:MAG: hypothetical protein ACTSRW_01315 [Candidatus Helarchaeota archaeon]
MADSETLIHNVLFIKTGGTLLFSLRDLGDSGSLVSGYLEAVRSFSTELEEVGEIQSIQLSKLSFSYSCKSSEFSIIILHDSRVPLDEIRILFQHLNDAFLDHYTEKDIKNWRGNHSFFKPFLPTLSMICQRGEKKISARIITWEAKHYELKVKDIFKNPEILSLTVIESQENGIQTYVNDSLDDFEIQVFISSPYLNRTLQSLIPMLVSLEKLLLNSSNSYFIGKTLKFHMALKQTNGTKIGIIGTTRDAVEEAIKQT